jgi:hypothetical protein
MPLPCGPAQENGVLPACGSKKIISIFGPCVEVFAYSAAHIAELEKDILFIG